MFDRLKSLLNAKPASAANTPAHAAAPADATLVNAYCTVREAPPLDFAHTLHARRDLSDPELRPHLDGFINYVLSRGDGQMTRVRYHLMRHLQRVNQHLSLAVGERDFDAFAAWAEAANAVVFLPDGGVRDPQGRVLIDGQGDSDPAAQIPYPAAAWARKARTDALLAARGIRVMESLPPLICEPELNLRGSQECAGRAMALFITALRAETLNSDEPMPVAEIRDNMPTGFDYLSPKEQQFFTTSSPSPQDIAQFAWRYECLAVLEWALGMIDDLPFPAAICDVPMIAERMIKANAPSFPNKAKLVRTPGEILDALDLHYRLHWAVRQSRAKEGTPPPEGVDGGVVLERHYALNWMVRFEDAEWDAVDTPT